MDIEINCRQIKTLEVLRINGENNRRIRLIGVRPKINSWEVDVYLIAAAPELLEALRELIQTHEYSLRIGYERINELGGDCDSPELMINKDSSLNKAKAAIAKALGQQ